MRLMNALVTAVLATGLMTVPSVAQTYGDHPHMGTWGWGGTIFGLIMSIIFIVVVVVAVVLLVRWLGGPSIITGWRTRTYSSTRFTPRPLLQNAKGYR